MRGAKAGLEAEEREGKEAQAGGRGRCGLGRGRGEGCSKMGVGNLFGRVDEGGAATDHPGASRWAASNAHTTAAAAAKKLAQPNKHASLARVPSPQVQPGAGGGRSQEGRSGGPSSTMMHRTWLQKRRRCGVLHCCTPVGVSRRSDSRAALRDGLQRATAKQRAAGATSRR